MLNKLKKLFNKKGAALMTVMMVMVVLTTVGTVFASVVFTFYKNSRSDALSAPAEYEAKSIIDTLTTSITSNEQFSFDEMDVDMSINDYFSELRLEANIPSDMDEEEYFEKYPLRLTGNIDGNKRKSYVLELSPDGLSIKVTARINLAGKLTTLSSTVKMLLTGFTNEELKNNMENIFNKTPTYYVYEQKNLCFSKTCGFQYDYWLYNTADRDANVVPGHLHVAMRGDSHKTDPIAIAFAPGKSDGNVDWSNAVNGKKAVNYESLKNNNLLRGVANSNYVNRGAILAIDYNASTGVLADVIVNGPCTIYGGVRAGATQSNNIFTSTDPTKKPGELGGSLFVNGDCTIYNQNIGGRLVANGNVVGVNSIVGWNDTYFSAFGFDPYGKVTHQINGSMYMTQTADLYRVVRDPRLRISHDFFVRDHAYLEGVTRLDGNPDQQNKSNYNYVGGDFVVKNLNFSGDSAKYANNVNLNDTDLPYYYRPDLFVNKDNTIVTGAFSVKGNLIADKVVFTRNNDDIVGNNTDTQFFVGGNATLTNSIVEKSKRFYVGQNGSGDFYMEGGYFRGEAFDDNVVGQPQKRNGVDASGNVTFKNVGNSSNRIRIDHIYASGNILIENCDTDVIKFYRANGNIDIVGDKSRNVATRFGKIECDGNFRVSQNSFDIIAGYGSHDNGIFAGGNISYINTMDKVVDVANGLGRVVAGGSVEISHMTPKRTQRPTFWGVQANGDIIISQNEFQIQAGYSIESKRGSVKIANFEGVLRDVTAYGDVVFRTNYADAWSNSGNVTSVTGNVIFKDIKMDRIGAVTAKGAVLIENGTLQNLGKITANQGTIDGETYGVKLLNVSDNTTKKTNFGGITATGRIYLESTRFELSNSSAGIETNGNLYSKWSECTTSNTFADTFIRVGGDYTIENRKEEINNNYEIRANTIIVGQSVNWTYALIFSNDYNIANTVNIKRSSIGSRGTGQKGTLKFGVTNQVQNQITIVDSLIVSLSVYTNTNLELIQTFCQNVDKLFVKGNLTMSKMEDVGFLKNADGENTLNSLFRFNNFAVSAWCNDVLDYYVSGNLRMTNVFNMSGDSGINGVGGNNNNFYAYVGGDMIAEKTSASRNSIAKPSLPMVGATILGKLEIKNMSIDKYGHGVLGTPWIGGGRYNWVIKKTMTITGSGTGDARPTMWKNGQIYIQNTEGEQYAAKVDSFILFRWEGGNKMHTMGEMVYNAIVYENGAFQLSNAGIVDNNLINTTYAMGGRYARNFGGHNGEGTAGLYGGFNIDLSNKNGGNYGKPISAVFEMKNIQDRVEGRVISAYADAEPHIMAPNFSVSSKANTTATNVATQDMINVATVGNIAQGVQNAPLNFGYNWNDFEEKTDTGSTVVNYHFYQQQTHTIIGDKKTVPLDWRVPSDKYAPGINNEIPLGTSNVKKRVVSRKRLSTVEWGKSGFPDTYVSSEEWYTAGQNYIIRQNGIFPLNPATMGSHNGLRWEFITYANNTSNNAVSISFDPQGSDLHIKVPKGMELVFGAGVHFDMLSEGRVFLYLQSGAKISTIANGNAEDQNKGMVGAQAYDNFVKQNGFTPVRQGGKTSTNWESWALGIKISGGWFTHYYGDNKADGNWQTYTRHANQLFFIGNGENIDITITETRFSAYIYMPYAKSSQVTLINNLADSAGQTYDRFSFYGAVVAQNIRYIGYARAIIPDVKVDLSGLNFLYLQNLPPGSSGDSFNGFETGWVFEGYS